MTDTNQEMKEFPPFRVDLRNQCLWRGSERITLTPKAFAVLLLLVEHAGRLVTHDQLLDAIWPDASVQPEVLKSHILTIRHSLGDSAKNPSFIETLPRRGYRFIAPVHARKEQRGAEPVSAVHETEATDALQVLRHLREELDLAITALTTLRFGADVTTYDGPSGMRIEAFTEVLRLPVAASGQTIAT
jgi:DNA-binding winged helix-turn-helix (wHTH) protein